MNDPTPGVYTLAMPGTLPYAPRMFVYVQHPRRLPPMLLTLTMTCALALGAVACETSTPGTEDATTTTDVQPQDSGPITVNLIDNTLWTLVPPDEDPWFAGRDQTAKSCEEPDVSVEELPDGKWFDVITKNCNYMTATQPLAADIPAGATLHVRIWHFAITLTDGTYTIAFQVGTGGPALWTTTKVVPAESGLIHDTWVTTESYKKGDLLYYHLGNHGDNSWGLIELSATY